ncbi:MAG: cyclic nucleotide-binding domain-containing protein [Chloroflexi bacterium]|nr:cyclic nucleotide-binding domain-containing protein [Chloroflexota bacterium]
MSHEHLPASEIAERLRGTALFGGLDDAQLARLIEMGEIIDLAPGEALITEGEVATALFVVLEGELDVTKRSGAADVPLARVGPGSLQGEIAALEGGRRLATVRAVTEAEALRVPVDAMRELLAAGPDVALSVIRTAVGRLRSMEGSLREREKLAGLGTLAAGLAHELNNPAAAASRSARALSDAVRSAESLPRPSPPPRPPEGSAPPTSALDRADRIDEVAALAGSAEAASALVDAGWTAELLREQPPEVLPWLAADASVHQLLDEVAMAVNRISEIVSAVKGYAYLDQAPRQRIEVRIGIEQTLVILRHRLRDAGVEVVLEIADDLPEIEAFGSELNQVWTNLVDNAIDAMDGPGTLTIRAEREAAGVRVTICNPGPPIPDEVRQRLFEPFYTTKPPGKGTGLGLHISHNVVLRHGGSIEVSSEDGTTCFAVILPLAAP